LAFLQHKSDEEAEIQARVIKARELYAGYIDADLADVGAEILIGADESDVEGVNLMAIAIDTTIRRITLTGFEVAPPPGAEGEEGSTAIVPGAEGAGGESDSATEAVDAWLQKFYEVNKLDVVSRELHRQAERDGEAFLILDYDPEYIYPRDPSQVGIAKLFVHERFTSADNAWKGLVGNNNGCKAHYRNDDVNQPLDMVSKRWIEEYWEDEEIKARPRMTLYINQVGTALAGDLLPARIEKYELNEAGEWVPYKDLEDQDWPIWWTEGASETGASLPLPVIHFRNEEAEPAHKKIWGLQASMDQLWISFMHSQLLSGHQLLVAFGFYPTTDEKPPEDDGSNLFEIKPRSIIGSAGKTPKDASLTAIPAAPAEPLLMGLDKTAIYAAFVGSLPVSNFIFSKAVASSETLKQGDAELVAKINELIGLWSHAWSTTLEAARSIENSLGAANLDPLAKLVPMWAAPERRDMNHLTKEAQAKRQAGVPELIILQEVWGYTPEMAAAYLEQNLVEHSRGIGPEVTVPPDTGGGSGQEKTVSEQPANENISGAEHGNSAAQQATAATVS
jgi:hypothetical protein